MNMRERARGAEPAQDAWGVSSTFDTRRVRRMNCRLPTQVRPEPSVFDSKCIRVDDGRVSMSDKGTAVESAFRLGFCAWAKAQAAHPRQKEHTVLAV